MARYKHIDTSPRFIAVDLQQQLLPGSFEHALDHLIDHELDLSGFDARYRNDQTGASAYLYRGVLREDDILSSAGGQVRFRYRDSQRGEMRERSLSGADFLRLILHTSCPRASGERAITAFCIRTRKT